MKKAIKGILSQGLFMVCKPSLILLSIKNPEEDLALIDKWVHTTMGRFYLRGLDRISRIK